MYARMHAHTHMHAYTLSSGTRGSRLGAEEASTDRQATGSTQVRDTLDTWSRNH